MTLPTNIAALDTANLEYQIELLTQSFNSLRASLTSTDAVVKTLRALKLDESNEQLKELMDIQDINRQQAISVKERLDELKATRASFSHIKANRNEFVFDLPRDPLQPAKSLDLAELKSQVDDLMPLRERIEILLDNARVKNFSHMQIKSAMRAILLPEEVALYNLIKDETIQSVIAKLLAGFDDPQSLVSQKEQILSSFERKATESFSACFNKLKLILESLSTVLPRMADTGHRNAILLSACHSLVSERCAQALVAAVENYRHEGRTLSIQETKDLVVSIERDRTMLPTKNIPLFQTAESKILGFPSIIRSQEQRRERSRSAEKDRRSADRFRSQSQGRREFDLQARQQPQGSSQLLQPTVFPQGTSKRDVDYPNAQTSGSQYQHRSMSPNNFRDRRINNREGNQESYRNPPSWRTAHDSNSKYDQQRDSRSSFHENHSPNRSRPVDRNVSTVRNSSFNRNRARSPTPFPSDSRQNFHSRPSSPLPQNTRSPSPVVVNAQNVHQNINPICHCKNMSNLQYNRR